MKPAAAKAGSSEVPASPAAEEGIAIPAQPNGAVALSIHLCAIVLGAAALYFGKDFFLPVVLGFLFALTLIPIVRALARRGVPAGLSATALVLCLAVGLIVGAYFLSGPVAGWIDQAPTIGMRIEEKLRSLRGSVAAVAEAGKQVDELSKATADPSVQEVVIKEPGFLATATSTLWSGITTVGIALLLVLFLLASGDMVYEKIIRILPTLSDKKKALRIVHDIEASISRYLLTVASINAGLGVAIGLAMWALGMPSPAVWGVAATILNFLPYLGAIIGVALTATVAFISLDPLGYAVLAPLSYLALTAIEGNIVTPLILGRRLELNTVALFIGVAFWGWVWGVVGVFMAVPLLVVVKVCCDHLPSWSALGEFLSITPPKSEVEKDNEEPDLNPIVRT